MLAPVATSLARNFLLIAPVAGLLWSATSNGHGLPGAFDQFLTLLGNASSPCALITIGLFLTQQQGTGDRMTVGRIVGLKLLLQPAITIVLALVVFPMETTWAHAAILLSALPVGTGPFMLAKLYNRDAAVTSRSILVSTILSVISISALIFWLEHT